MSLNDNEKIFSIAGNIAVIIGVIVAIVAGIVAYLQYQQNERKLILDTIEERKRVAIETLRGVENILFIKAYTRLKTIYVEKVKSDTFCKEKVLCRIYDGNQYINNCDALVDDINLVLVSYNYIAMLYKNDMVDKNIIYSTIYQDLRVFAKIMEYISCGFQISMNIHYFDLMLEDFIKLDWASEKDYRINEEEKYIEYLHMEEKSHEIPF